MWRHYHSFEFAFLYGNAQIGEMILPANAAHAVDGGVRSALRRWRIVICIETCGAIMPRKEIRRGTTARGEPEGSAKVTGPDPELPLPHERDENAEEQRHPGDPKIEQAHDDLNRGLLDTEAREKATMTFNRRWPRSRRRP